MKALKKLIAVFIGCQEHSSQLDQQKILMIDVHESDQLLLTTSRVLSMEQKEHIKAIWQSALSYPEKFKLLVADGIEGAVVIRKPIIAESTPSSHWKQNGEADPHGNAYDCERARLARGNLTDDELANAVYLCDHRTSFESIGYLTAAKDRIRWLSRRLEDAMQNNDATRFAWLCADLPTSQERELRLSIIKRMSVMGEGAIRAAVDAAMQESCN